MTSNYGNNSSAKEAEIRENIKKRVLNLERENLAQREFNNAEMEQKIRKIIEEEVGK